MEKYELLVMECDPLKITEKAVLYLYYNGDCDREIWIPKSIILDHSEWQNHEMMGKTFEEWGHYWNVKDDQACCVVVPEWFACKHGL